MNIKHTLTHREDEVGFTLIEILVVIIIIGILAAVAIPIFLNQRKAAWDTAVEQDARNVGSALMGRAKPAGMNQFVIGENAPSEVLPAHVKDWNVENPDEPLVVSEGTILEISYSPVGVPAAGILKLTSNDVCIKAGNHNGERFKGVQHGENDLAENFVWFDSRAGGLTTAQEIYEKAMADGTVSTCYFAGMVYATQNGLPAPPALPEN